MASHKEFLFDWSYIFRLEYDKWTKTDLQLAAELGKTLLERNKELETLLKEHKITVEEQEQEILYLKKHTTALREVNDSRLKVYEQLEVGIQELERANHRLLVENTSDKKHIKTLTHNVESLETRCDELNKQLDELRQLLSTERRKNERLLQEKNAANNEGNKVRLRSVDHEESKGNKNSGEEVGFDANTTAPENCSFAFQSPGQRNSTGNSGSGTNGCSSFEVSGICSGDEEIIKLVNDLETTKRAFQQEQQKCGELEEQLVAIIQENQTLQSRLVQTSTNEEMKSMQEELSILDEVRQGQMCSRCLRAIDDRATINDEQSSLAATEECDEDDDRSLLDTETETPTYMGGAGVSIKVMPRVPDSLDLGLSASPNPYRDLVEKYEALLEVQRSSMARKAGSNNNNNNNNNNSTNTANMPLADELQSTEKLMMQTAANVLAGNCSSSSQGDNASSCNGSTINESSTNKSNKNVRGRTPTEFSEAETSSSGFSDETSNKGTQTDDRPGYFLCSIGDGEDCKFSIYDDFSPIDSRFRNRPEYRELFKEIFAVLKKAAENKEEGEKLPLLDDTHPAAACGAVSKVPPVTPANEELPMDFGDDTQSIISSAVSEQSFAMSECITKLERRTAKKHITEKNQENQPPCLGASISQAAAPSVKQIIENGRVLTPLKREPLEYLQVGVGVKKKNRRKGRNFSNDRSESPVALPTPPRFFLNSGKKRKDARPLPYTPEQQQQHSAQKETPRSSRGADRNGAKYEWNGSSMIIYNRNANSPHPPPMRGREIDFSQCTMEFRPSTVSQDLHKLKKLDLSYAEVLRRADACKQHHHHHHNQQSQQQRRRNQQHR